MISVGEFLLNDQFRAVKTVVKESDNGKMKYITEEKNIKLYPTQTHTKLLVKLTCDYMFFQQ